MQLLVQSDQEINGALLAAVHLGEVGLHQRCHGRRDHVGREFFGQRRLVPEGKVLCRGFQKEIKRVVDRHLDDQIDGHLEFPRLLGEHQTGLVVRKRILLPVHEMQRRLDLQGIGDHMAAAVRCRAQAYHLRPQGNQPVVGIVGDMAQRGVNGHGVLRELVRDLRRYVL